MKNNKYFELRCTINHGEQLSLRIPYSCHANFNYTISRGDDESMSSLVELFGEYQRLDDTKRKTFQSLIDERADQVSTLDDLLVLLKVVKLCDVYVPKK